MNLRRLTRPSSATKCRMCSSEIWADFHAALAARAPRNSPNYAMYSTSLQIEYAERETQQIERNRNNLYALDVQTSSGGKTEVICRRHLDQAVQAIVDALRNHV